MDLGEGDLDTVLFADLCRDLLETPLWNITTAAVYSTPSYNETYNITESTFDLRSWCENQRSSISDEPPNEPIRKQLQYYLSGILGLLVCILGFIGNGMSIMVLRGKDYKQSSTFIYLIALAVSDSLVLLTACTLSINDVLSYSLIARSPEFIAYKAYTFPYIHPLATTFQYISIWLTLGFTIDRYIMICHPFHGIKYCSRRRAVHIVIGIYILGFIYNIPRFFEFETKIIHTGDSSTIPYAVPTKFGSSKVYLQVVHLWTYVIFVFILPCVTLAVLNTMLGLAVRRSRHSGRRMSLGNSVSTRNDTTLMLIAVVVIFLICQMPALVSHTIWASKPGMYLREEPRYNYLHVIQEIGNFLVLLNSAINILLYYMFSIKFRAQFTKIFCQSCRTASKFIVAEFRRLSVRSNFSAETETAAVDTESGSTIRMSRLRGYCSNDWGQSDNQHHHAKMHPVMEESSSLIAAEQRAENNAINLSNNNRYMISDRSQNSSVTTLSVEALRRSPKLHKAGSS